MGRRVRIFHLSDLHARSTSGPQAERAQREASFRWRVIGPAWEDNLRDLQSDEVAVDLVVFTGDLGDWGHETDYAKGVEFLRRTCAALKVPMDRLFVVPGNHDIARKTEEEAWKTLREKMARAGLPGSDWMAGGKAPPEFKDEWRDAVLHRQASFWKVVTEDLGRGELAPWQHRHKRLGYQVLVALDGLAAPLWIVGLDTSWLAGDEHDAGKLWLTEHQVGLHTTDREGAELPGFRLALMHHRFADLADGERMRRHLADRVDLLLHGHQHEPMAELWNSPDHGMLVLAAGCLYEGDEQHRYPNACQMIDVELTDAGRPERATVRFRGWAERNGLFWGDDSLLYKSARGGRLVMDRVARGWQVQSEARPPAPPQPEARSIFVGRRAELEKLVAAMNAGAGARVAVQGMAGVGKSYLIEKFCAEHRGRFGPVCRWVLDPAQPAAAAQGLLELARQAGLDVDRIAPSDLGYVLNERSILIHIDNVDSRAAEEVVADLLAAVPKQSAIVTGRYMFGDHWQQIEVECFDLETSVALLRRKLNRAMVDSELRNLAEELGGLPLALNLAAGYLNRSYSSEGFLRELRAKHLTLPLATASDPLRHSRSRGIIAAAFEISRKLFLAEAAERGTTWEPALSALGWAPLEGFGHSLGAAIVGVPPEEVEPFLVTATELSFLRWSPGGDRRSVHPLVAEFLRAGSVRGPVDERMAAWVAEHGRGDPEGRGARWAELSRESAAVHAWLAEVDESVLTVVLPRCWEYGVSHGPAQPWFDAARRTCTRLSSGRSAVAWAWAQLASRMGIPEEVLLAAEIVKEEGSEHAQAGAAGLIADILVARGELDEGLRIRREQLPVYERLGDVRSKAVTMGQIADILVARGDLGEGLRILREEALPVYERLGAVRDKAVTMGKIADILVARGDLDEGLRIRREETLPVYERLGDVRSKAVTMGKIADILVARGDLDEGLRIRREEELPVYERLGGHDLMAGLANLAILLIRRGDESDLQEARRHLERSAKMAKEMGIPFSEDLVAWLASDAGRARP